MIAACAAAVLFFTTRQPPFLRDSPRLVLLAFLISAAIWGVVNFTSIHTTTQSGCQVAVSFSSLFDQFARSAILQALLWALSGGVGTSRGVLIPQVALGLRLALGCVFAGFQRTEFRPVCLATNSLMPLGISLLCVDEVIALSLLAVCIGRVRLGRSSADAKPEPRNILVLPIAGVGIWVAVRVCTPYCSG